ncbi:MAG: hypothetical protein OXC80_02495 [Gammaproteobacteria bacterium]|nr:hypothetical protein [Gammaproteobacteria bacterium]
MIQALFRLWDVCIFRAGPGDLPRSYYFLVLVVVFSYAVDLLLTQLILPELMPYWYYRPLLWFVVLGVILYGILAFRSVPLRFLQTYIALNGTALYLSLIGLVLCTFFVSLTGVILLALLAWQVVIHGRIITLAIQTKRWVGVLIALSIVMIMNLLATAIA